MPFARLIATAVAALAAVILGVSTPASVQASRSLKLVMAHISSRRAPAADAAVASAALQGW